MPRAHLRNCAEWALAVFQRAAEVDHDASWVLIKEGRQCVETMQGWAQLCPENFAHKALLLEAVCEDVSGLPNPAWEHFQVAAEMADAAGFPVDAALALEFAARMRFGRGDREAATSLLEAAIEKYRAWGANAKTEHLAREFGVALRTA